MDAIKETVKELGNLGINGTLLDVVITSFAPWTLSYVRYDDGMIGCGCAYNEAEGGIPEDVSFIKDWLSLNTYDVLDELESLEKSVFINSLRTSITSALSHRLMNDGNGTINELLDFSRDARTRIIYGPSSAFYPKVLFKRGVNISLPVIFPNTPDFKRRFALSRGYWYFMGDVTQMLIKRK